MIDINLLRENPDVFRASQRARGKDETHVDRILEADTARRALIGEYENLRAEQNAFGKQVAKAPKEEKPALVAQAKELAAHVANAKAASEAKTAEYEELLSSIENLIIDGVPTGGEDDFVVLKEVGTPRDFSTEGFEPRDHLEIGELIGGIDMARGAKVSGSRFYFLKGQVARLEQALMWMALDLATANGFTMMTTPTLVRPEIMNGTGFNVKHDDEIYRLERDDLYLVGTSEVALAGMHENEILDLSDGPLRYCGWSSCYRREAGAAGKDTSGIIRVHQFDKVEMFVYTKQEDSYKEHEHLLAMEQEMLGKVEVPYRIIDTAAGDLGSSAARKFDCEAWVPTQGRYRELTSTSNCTEYQARRLNIRERMEDGNTRAVSTLNGTLATTRWLVAILENHQQKDGSIVIPQAMRAYMGGKEVIEPTKWEA